ncbi:AMP-binding protein (plasmid) [Rhodococcus sp. USK10]|uniref:AMP-binding protein n=1 Tax=Rhodococcus sp. USK10 TaxID=2789739 RepID=UPI001C6016D4|nr:AMP-binding protein [Rhodococcus sp. USK10]QYB00234.1 AMP-binding protein [Rhodococcus sp. USK10]
MNARLPQPWWQDLNSPKFTWTVPSEFNIAQACVDLQEPNDCALIVDADDRSTEYTFGEVASLSRKFSTVLKHLGLNAGERIGVMVPQGIEVLTAHLGAFRAGVVTVPLSVKFGPDAVYQRLRDSQTRVLVVDAKGFARIRDSLVHVPSLEAVLLIGETPFGTSPIDIFPYDRLVAEAAEDPETAATGPDSHAIIIYTSGTTGSPKGALHGHRILPAHMPGVRIAFSDAPQPQDVFWTPADWAWIGGLFDVLFPALAMGCTVIATPDQFTPARALEVMRRYKVTASFIPPTALKQMRSTRVDRASAEGVRLRALATGGESLGEALLAWVKNTFGVAINEFYGQTEMNMTIGTSRSAWAAKPGSMGQAFPGFTVALLDPIGDEVDTGQIGEICVATGNPGQFLRYWNQPGETSDKVHGGWIHTGDLGRSDNEGNLWYEGRIDDVISSAGYRIGPGEIEECLLSHDAVAMAGVIGVPDELRGEAVRAFVVLAVGVSESEALRKELQDHVKSQLAFYQYPRQITFIDQLPQTATGKILRRELKHLAEDATDQ